jgi:hypothetical protein
MDAEVGPTKAANWRASGRLETRDDPLTGSKDPLMIEYKVPVEWMSTGTSDTMTFGTKVDSEATEQDLELMGGCTNSGNQLVPVKKEPLTEEEKAKETTKDFKATVGQKLRMMQEFVLESKILTTAAETVKYTDGMKNDNIKHLQKLQKVVKILENVATGRQMNDEEIPKLSEMCEVLVKEHRELGEWASRFGLPFGGRQPAKKRRV